VKTTTFLAATSASTSASVSSVEFAGGATGIVGGGASASGVGAAAAAAVPCSRAGECTGTHPQAVHVCSAAERGSAVAASSSGSVTGTSGTNTGSVGMIGARYLGGRGRNNAAQVRATVDTVPRTAQVTTHSAILGNEGGVVLVPAPN